MSNSDEKKPQTFLNTEKNKKDASDVHLTNSKETEKASATQRKDSQLEPSRKALPKKTVPESVEKINHKEEIEKTKQEQYLKLKDKGNLLVKQVPTD